MTHEIDNPKSPIQQRQTLSYLRNLFEERGIRPKSKLGQNFLIDLNLLDFLLQNAELTKDDAVLEVGSSTGSLTVKLCEHAGGVLSVEIDPAFQEMVKDAVLGQPNVVLMHVDILRNKNELNPGVVSAWRELQSKFGCARLKLVSNLPYAVATPVIANLLLSDLTLERMVVTVQWEIAERLTARPGTKDYGALAVLVQSVAEVKILRRLPPSVFWPRPEVASAIVAILPNENKRAEVGDVVRFRSFLRDLYTHRRKNLRGALLALPGFEGTKEDADQKLRELEIDAASARNSLTWQLTFG